MRHPVFKMYLEGQTKPIHTEGILKKEPIMLELIEPEGNVLSEH